MAQTLFMRTAKTLIWSDWANVQADLSLRWTQMLFCWFCHEAAQMIDATLSWFCLNLGDILWVFYNSHMRLETHSLLVPVLFSTEIHSVTIICLDVSRLIPSVSYNPRMLHLYRSILCRSSSNLSTALQVVTHIILVNPFLVTGKQCRPRSDVSLTCVPCKLLEHIVYSNIMAHLDKYKLLSDRQHAFRKGHSCETQLTTVINDWAKVLNNRGLVDTFILDFEKAFDTPPHELLKSKLFSYGICGKTLKWIDSFLCFRQQRVVVNGVKSDWAPVLSDVPQGTVLGPLLFSLYINDISSDIESEIRLFADDCVCYREIKDEKDTMKLQRDVDRLGSWARKWGMRFQLANAIWCSWQGNGSRRSMLHIT